MQVRYLIALLIASTPLLSLAGRFGVGATYPLVFSEPNRANAYQIKLIYDPERFRWRKFNVFFDGGFTHVTDTGAHINRSMNFYSASPVARYTFTYPWPVNPYIDIGIGVSYRDHTRLGGRNMGIHFAFEDRIGAGLIFGRKQEWTLGIQALHFSNCHFASNNAGVTFPVMVTLAYRLP